MNHSSLGFLRQLTNDSLVPVGTGIHSLLSLGSYYLQILALSQYSKIRLNSIQPKLVPLSHATDLFACARLETCHLTPRRFAFLRLCSTSPVLVVLQLN